MPLTIYSHKQILDARFGSGTPATYYLARFTTAPAINGAGGVEVAGGTYARQAVTNNLSNFPAATDDGTTTTKTLANSFAYPVATTDEGTTKAIGLYDAPTGGNLHGYALVTDQAVPVGVQFTVLAGSTIQLVAA